MKASTRKSTMKAGHSISRLHEAWSLRISGWFVQQRAVYPERRNFYSFFTAALLLQQTKEQS